jgi:uncharacterized protein
VKHFKIALISAAVLAAALSSPAAAQLATAGLDFVEAVKKSDGDKVMKLLQDHPTGLFDAKDSDGDTGLIIALTRRDDQWTGFLLNNGADPNLAGKGGNSPLITAARVGYEDAVGWLLGMGAKVDATNKMGETALIAAVQTHQAPIVRLLLQAGADPDRTDSAQGFSARDYAARDTRARDILKLIEARKPKPAAAH